MRFAFKLRLLVVLVVLAAQLTFLPLTAAGDEAPVLVARYGGGDSCRKCRSYALDIYLSGRVVYNGTTVYYELPPNSSRSVERAARESTVSTEVVDKWIRQLADEGFFSLPASYDARNCPRDGGQERAITVNVGEQSKTVVWIECLSSSAPGWLRDVATGIKRQIDPGQWQQLVPPFDR